MCSSKGAYKRANGLKCPIVQERGEVERAQCLEGKKKNRIYTQEEGRERAIIERYCLNTDEMRMELNVL